jgi:hypothetical protein
VRSNMFKSASKFQLGVLTACVLVVGMCSSPRASAQPFDKKTYITFSAPVEIPGMVLPAGTYVFKRLDSASARNIVQIFDKDEKKLYATILAISDYRLMPTDQTVIRFEERASSSPEAVKAWFYPGEDYGLQFVYPHDRAVALAKRTNQNVLSMRNDMTQNITAPAKSAGESSIQAMQNTEVTAVKPSGEQVDMGQAASTKRQ